MFVKFDAILAVIVRQECRYLGRRCPEQRYATSDDLRQHICEYIKPTKNSDSLEV